MTRAQPQPRPIKLSGIELVRVGRALALAQHGRQVEVAWRRGDKPALLAHLARMERELAPQQPN